MTRDDFATRHIAHLPGWLCVGLTAAWGALLLALAVYLGMHGA